MLLLSVAIAAASCVGPLIFADESQFGWAVYASLLLALVWACIAVVSIIRYKARGLWILCGLPLIATWPIFYVLLALGGIRK